MAAEIKISHDDLYADVRRYLLELFPDVEVIRGYGNNMPLPPDGFILMNIIHETNLSTSVSDYDGDENTATVEKTVEVMMQIDFYGETSGNMARIFSNLWRDYHAAERLLFCQPLYCDAPKFLPMNNEFSEFEERWMATVYLNYNPAVKHSQDFVSGVADISVVCVQP